MRRNRGPENLECEEEATSTQRGGERSTENQGGAGTQEKRPHSTGETVAQILPLDKIS